MIAVPYYIFDKFFKALEKLFRPFAVEVPVYKTKEIRKNRVPVVELIFELSEFTPLDEADSYF